MAIDLQHQGLPQKFNHDLLTNEGDLHTASLLFPKIVSLLDYPDLRVSFLKYDETANRARARLRRLGLCAVVCITTALIALTTHEFWAKSGPREWLGLGIEISGMVAAFVAIGGLWLGPWKSEWLKSRLITERIRQWHFQLFVRRGREVEEALRDATALAEFERKRTVWFTEFLTEYENNAGAKLRAFTTEHQNHAAWLHDKSPGYAPGSSVLLDVFSAFQRLRFDHQCNYASYKLQETTDKNLWAFEEWPEPVQLKVIESGAAFCFWAAFLISLLSIIGHLDHGHFDEHGRHVLNAVAISIALVGAALHTVQDGFALDQEIERYSGYLTRTKDLATRFRQTEEQQEKIALMEELEIATVEEMRGFLRSHNKAKFIL